jgi:peptidoglycan hydrolase-like protein with peptidoglycan-binding domain
MMRKTILASCAALLLGIGAHAAEPRGSAADVRAIQQELAAHGYSPGKADGRLGARTRGAIEDYQRDAGLPVDGEPSAALLQHLRSPQARVHAKGLQVDQAAVPQDVVIRTQQLLESRGYYRGRMDGHVGPEAREAARRFQADAGLPQTGELNEALLDQLRKADPSIRAPRS